jgi:exopolyphosphatase/guanosine-5'-triphosphate,3'-diphosphate pyrophosphatase
VSPDDPIVPGAFATTEAAAHAEALALMHELENKPLHVQHVARLALSLFDQLLPLHGLGPRERLLLAAASLLHDIGHQYGLKQPGEGHHHESARLIRERRWIYFSPREVEVIAQIARYHRKTMPELKHDPFRALDDWSRHAVQRLAAHLRLADALDRTHQQLVRDVRVEIRPNQLLFHLDTTANVLREVTAAHGKGDLAQAVFQRDLFFLVGDQVIRPVPPTRPA